MQLASHGARVFPGRVSQWLPHAPGAGGSRSIHTPSFLRVPHSRPTQFNSARRLFEQSKSIFNRFVVHLITPGLGTGVSSVGSLHNAGSGFARSSRASIQQGYSLPVRQAISRPFGPYHFPKPPTVPRSVFQVGLGTARQFHSTRPIFQNFVENVPVVGRALSEADWEIKMKEEKQKVRLSKKGSSKGRGSKEMMKPIEKKAIPASADLEEVASEFENYFASPVCPQIITYLLIPLAPTPTGRNPLPSSHSPSLIPISVLLDMHSSYEIHSLRVSSLFARLDASRVWSHPGVSSSVYGDPSGLASILKIGFQGWSEAEVRAVIGEAGTGWCILEEADESNAFQSSPNLSGISTPLTGIEEEMSESSLSPDLGIDPARSLVLPSLDFSDYEIWSDVQSMPSPLMLPSANQLQVDTVHNYNSDDGLDSYDRMSSSSDGSASWMALSVSSGVSEGDDEPREYMF